MTPSNSGGSPTIINNGSFLSDRRGSVAILFALSLIPVVAFVGSAIDYARALSAKTRLQAITDMATQAGARIPATANANRLQAAVNSFRINAEGTVAAQSTPNPSPARKSRTAASPASSR